MSTARHEIPPEMLCEVGLEPQGVYDVYNVSSAHPGQVSGYELW